MEQEIRRAYNGIYEDSTEEPLARWRRLVRAEDWIRVCIIVGPVAFPMCFPVITDGTDIGRDRLLSRMLAANWKAPFMDAMESGKCTVLRCIDILFLADRALSSGRSREVPESYDRRSTRSER